MPNFEKTKCLDSKLEADYIDCKRKRFGNEIGFDIFNFSI